MAKKKRDVGRTRSRSPGEIVDSILQGAHEMTPRMVRPIAVVAVFGVLSGCMTETSPNETRNPPDPQDEAEAEFLTWMEDVQKSSETWRCYKYSEELFSSPAVKLRANYMLDMGNIQPKGLPEQVTEYRIDGLDRRWNWGAGSDGHFKYSFTIGPDGVGRSYNFSESETTAKPSNIFHECRKDWKAGSL